MTIAKIAAGILSVTLIAASAALAQTGKTTVAKERAAGTTGAVGNRCAGGTYDSCVQANMKTGSRAQSAAAHCARTCAK